VCELDGESGALSCRGLECELDIRLASSLEEVSEVLLEVRLAHYLGLQLDAASVKKSVAWFRPFFCVDSEQKWVVFPRSLGIGSEFPWEYGSGHGLVDRME
jgi:hypothetical protein